MRPLRGMSFMDVVVGTALMLIIFLALFTLLRSSLVVTSVTKSRAIATSLAESQMEHVRSLPYDTVGTVGGIPAGPVAQYATTTSNGVVLVTRTNIEYVDDPKDGLDAADQNGITTDYKRIKVSVTYTAAGKLHSVDLVSNYAPLGIETSNGGGTLKVQVVGATGAPVSGASVRIVNASIAPSVDVTTFTNVAGSVYLPGAATSTDYQIAVSKNGYSSAQTYLRDATNQNPTPGYLTVVKNQTTTGTFAIDLLASLTVRTFSPMATTTWSDAFADSSKVAAQSGVAIAGGSVTLSGGAGSYGASGTLRSIVLAPQYLGGWLSASASAAAPPGASLVFHVVDGAGALLPENVLPGNSAGFSSTIDLTQVPKGTYPSLALKADLATNDPAVTPALTGWSIDYLKGPLPLPGIAFSLTGNKTIGSTGAGVPIYKTNVSNTTDASGVRILSLEWDAYQLTLASHDIVDACNAPPYTLSPGSSLDSSLVLGPSTANSLLVSVRDATSPLATASVTLSRPGYTRTVDASDCGAAYFGSVSSASDYTITVSATGYTSVTATGVSVSGKTFYAASL